MRGYIKRLYINDHDHVIGEKYDYLHNWNYTNMLLKRKFR